MLESPHAAKSGAASADSPAVDGEPPESDREAALTTSRVSVAWCVGVPAAVVLLTLVVFVPAMAAGFVHWDDDDLLFGTSRYHEISPSSLAWMWSTTYAGHFQPLTWLSYAVDFQWAGFDPFGYHLTNVVLHLINAALFYFLSLGLLRRGLGDGRGASRALRVSAGCAAILFAVHPLRAESVAWIAERRDVLSGMFYLLALLCYVRYASAWVPNVVHRGSEEHAGQRHVGGTFWLVASFVSFVLATQAKASTVMLPVVLLLLDVYPLRRVSPGGRLSGGAMGRAVVEKTPFLVVSGIVGALAINAQHVSGALSPLSGHDLASRAAQACYGLAFYVWKTLLPIGLGPLYPIPETEVLFGWMLASGLATIGALAVLAVATRRRFPVIWVTLAAFAVQILPVVGILQSGPQLVADRYSYLACMGFAVLGGAACLWLMLHPVVWSPPSRKAIGVFALAVCITLLSHATFLQASYWDMPLTLWRRGVEISQNSSIAHVNYADAVAEAGDLRLALAHYRRGLQLNPRDSIAMSHVGRVLVRAGDHGNAVGYFAAALRTDPTRSADYRRLAQALIGSGYPEKAAMVLRDRARSAPHEIATVEMLADLLATYPEAEIRNGDEAVRWATHAYQVRGRAHAPVLLLLATALAEDGQFDRAVRVSEAALVLARASQDARLAFELQRRLALFEARRPYHFGS